MVVLTTETQGARTIVTVAPMSTQPPHDGDSAVEVPAQVRNHLGLGDRRSWIVSGELNRFVWPGPDLRPILSSQGTTPYYGNVPERLLLAVRKQIAQAVAAGKMRTTKRTE